MAQRKGTVEYIYRANVGQMVQAEQRLVHSGRQVHQSLGQIAESTGRMHAQTNQHFRSIGHGVSTIMAGYAAMGMFNMAIASVGDTLTKKYDFEKTMTPLLSLGGNTKGLQNIEMTKRKVLDLSTAWGRTNKEMHDFLFWSESSGSGLPTNVIKELQKSSLMMSKATGGEPMTAINLMTKAYRQYGDQVKSVTDLSNKLFMIQERGATDFESMATLLPNMLPVAKKVGYSLEEAGALYITATQMQGRNEIANTGVRSFLASLVEAEKKGIVLTGDLYDKLLQLQKLSAQDVMSLGGREAFAVISALADKVDEIRGNVQALEMVSGDTNAEKVRQRYGDRAFVQSEIRGVQKQKIENIPLDQRSRTTGMSELDILAGWTEIGFKKAFPEFLWGAVDSGLGKGAITAVDAALLGGQLSKTGQEVVYRDLVRAGDADQLGSFLKENEKVEAVRKNFGAGAAWGGIPGAVGGGILGSFVGPTGAVIGATAGGSVFGSLGGAYGATSKTPIRHPLDKPEWFSDEAYARRRKLVNPMEWGRKWWPEMFTVPEKKSKFRGFNSAMPKLYEERKRPAIDLPGMAQNIIPMLTGGEAGSAAREAFFAQGGPHMEAGSFESWKDMPAKMRGPEAAPAPEMISGGEAQEMLAFLQQAELTAYQEGRGKGTKMVDGQLVRYDNAPRAQKYLDEATNEFYSQYGGRDRVNAMLGDDRGQWGARLRETIEGEAGAAKGTGSQGQAPAEVSVPAAEKLLEEQTSVLQSILAEQQQTRREQAQRASGGRVTAPDPSRGTADVVGAR